MKSIMLSYPGFQSLPRGVKQLLVASESNYFRDAKPTPAYAYAQRPAYHQAPRARTIGLDGGWSEVQESRWHN
jgi:hypothetical protein